MSKLPRPSVSRKSVASRQSTSRPSTSRPSVSRPSVSRPSVSRQSGEILSFTFFKFVDNLSLMICLFLISHMMDQFKFISFSQLSRWIKNPCLLCPPAKRRRTNKLKLILTILFHPFKFKKLKLLLEYFHLSFFIFTVYARQSTIGSNLVDAKGNVKKNVKTILEFLIEKEYPSKLTRKNLMNPTEATFKEVLRFVIRDWYPDFECTRLSSDVMELMSDFSYPYPLKESYFKPVGSPISWPFLLEALAFLCNLMKMMDYEAANVSQLYTINNKDEEEAEEELRHQIISAKYYREFQTSDNAANEDLKEKYLQELDIEGTKERLSAEIDTLNKEHETLDAENKKFPGIRAEFEAQISKVDDEIAIQIVDEEAVSQAIKLKQKEAENLQTEFTEMGVKLEEMKDYILNQHEEIKKLESIIKDQPPQHEVQKLKRHYHDLLDKVGY